MHVRELIQDRGTSLISGEEEQERNLKLFENRLKRQAIELKADAKLYLDMLGRLESEKY